MVWAVLLSSQRVSACEGSWGSAVPSVTHLLWTFGTGAACTRSGSLSCSNTCLSSSMALYIQQVNCGSARRAACDCGKTSCIGRLDFSRAVLTLCSSPLPPPHRPVHREVLCQWNGWGSLIPTPLLPASLSVSHVWFMGPQLPT